MASDTSESLQRYSVDHRCACGLNLHDCGRWRWVENFHRSESEVVMFVESYSPGGPLRPAEEIENAKVGGTSSPQKPKECISTITACFLSVSRQLLHRITQVDPLYFHLWR